MNEPHAGPVGLVRRTLAVLRAVAFAPLGIGLSEIARVTGMSKATCYRILGELEDERVVRNDEKDRTYVLGVGMFALTAVLAGAEGVVARVRDCLTALATVSQETCGIDVLLGDQVLIALQARGPLLIGQGGAEEQLLLPAAVTSTGKVLLAWSDDPEASQIAVANKPRRADGSVVTRRELEAELRDVRARGFGTAVDEVELGASAVSVPVFVSNEVAAAIWVGGPTFRLTISKMRAVVDEMRPVADEIADLLAAHDLRTLVEARGA